MKNFDLFVGIDWSGAKAPVQTRSIAVSTFEPGNMRLKLVAGPWSRTRVAQWIKGLSESGSRVLIGIDANFGYAHEIGKAQFGDDYNYLDLWQDVEAASRKQANYFALGFWQKWNQYFWTDGKQPAHMIFPKRRTEAVCGEAGYGWPESPFKLIGAKQVGKGGLAAMRMALDLKNTCGDDIAIWPFERKLAESRAKITMTEIYPRQFLRRFGHGHTKLKTLEDLKHILHNPSQWEARYFVHQGLLKNIKIQTEKTVTDHDTDAMISAFGLWVLCGSGRNIPDIYANPPQMEQVHASCEGWIFGVGDKA